MNNIKTQLRHLGNAKTYVKRKMIQKRR